RRNSSAKERASARWIKASGCQCQDSRRTVTFKDAFRWKRVSALRLKTVSIANSILPQDIAVSDLSSSNMRANHFLRGDFAESSEGGFEVFGPSTLFTACSLGSGSSGAKQVEKRRFPRPERRDREGCRILRDFRLWARRCQGWPSRG